MVPPRRRLIDNFPVPPRQAISAAARLLAFLLAAHCPAAFAGTPSYEARDWIAPGPAASEAPPVRQTARGLPVVAETDVIVAGGGVAGTAAALRAAAAGLSVLLVEPRNYFGHELTATWRTGAVGGKPGASTPLARAFLKELRAGGGLAETHFHPSRLRSLLHAKVAAHPRIETLFFCLPTGAVLVDGQVRGIVFASHNGRQAALARAVVDATAEGRIAGAAGVSFRRSFGQVETASRHGLLAKGATGGPRGAVAVPSHLGLLGDRFLVGENSLELTMEALSHGSDPAADISALHTASSLGAYVLMDHLEREGIDLPFDLAPETWFEPSPLLACREPLSQGEIDSLDFARVEAVLPEGVEGLVVTGRTVAGGIDTLPALLGVGELAGRAVAALAAATPALAPKSAPDGTDETAVAGFRVAELLGGIEPGAAYPEVTQASSFLPVRGRYDVVVVGGGTSGALAAVAAARRGARVALVEVLPNLGGVGSNQVNSYYWGVPWKSLLRLELGERIDLARSTSTSGPLEKVRFSGPKKMRALLELASNAGVQIHFQSFGAGAVLEGKRVAGVVVENATGRQALLADVVIDATGHGDIAAAAGAAWDKGRCTDGFLHEILQRGLRDPTHPRDISAAYLGVPVSSLTMTIRESRRVEGDRLLTFGEALREELHPDTVCRWRSNYDTHFPSSPNQSDLAQDWTAMLGLWRKPLFGSIPYRALLPRGLEGILVAGKAYSADHDALILARMQPDLEHLGEAAGTAAAMAAALGVTPRQIDVAKLQRELVRLGVLREQDVPGQDLAGAGPDPELLREQDLWRKERAAQFPERWGDSPASAPLTLEEQVARLGTGDHLDAMVHLYLAGSETVPLLRPLLQAADGPAREEAALLLGLAGDEAAIPVLLEYLANRNTRTFHYTLPLASSRESVPFYWSAAILLGRFGERQAVPLMVDLLALPPSPEEYRRIRRHSWADNLFSGVDQCGPLLADFLIVALGRIADPSAAEAVRPFLAVTRELDLAEENLAHDLASGIRTNAAWALARMGDDSGLPVLREMLDSGQALLRAYAARLLREIAETDGSQQPTE